MWFTKKITVPESNETKEVDAVQLWEVRWRSLYSISCLGTETDLINSTPEVEAFPTRDEAESFATSLKNAMTLLRQSARTKVTVTKAR